MEGIHYIIDDGNNKIAVQIDLRKYGKIWEDFIDGLTADMRQSDENIEWEDVKEELKRDGLL